MREGEGDSSSITSNYLSAVNLKELQEIVSNALMFLILVWSLNSWFIIRSVVISKKI